MKLSKEAVKGLRQNLVFVTQKDVRGLIETIEALHTGIDTLVEQLKAQGRHAEAEDVRRLGK